MRGISEERLFALPANAHGVVNLSRFPMPPAETANPGPHTPSADIGPAVAEHG